MRVRLENFDDKGSYRQREWSPAPFFDGTICREDDLKRCHSFTAQEDARRSELQQRLTELDEQSHEMRSVEIEVLQKALGELSAKHEYSEEMDECEAALADGQVTVRMAFGCYLGMAGEKGEFLDLEGDARMIWNLLPLIMLGTPCGKCERPRTMAEIRQLPEGLCQKCSKCQQDERR